MTALISLLVFLYFAQSRIEILECQINQTPCPQEIEEEFKVFLDKNFFLYDPSPDLKTIKASYPHWQKLVVRKLPFKKIVIAITTRQPAACLLMKDRHFFVDQEAVILHEVKTNPGLPEIEVQKFQEEEIRKGLQAIALLEQYSLAFERLKIEDSQLILFLPAAKVFLPSNDLSFKIASLQMILSQGKIEGKLPKTIDLRFIKPVISYD